MRKLEVRAKVEEQRIVLGEFEAGFADARKEFGIGVAEEIDRLHGIADDEASAALDLGPGGDEAADQLVLAAAGVLKLIDQQMTNAVGDGDERRRWAGRRGR